MKRLIFILFVLPVLGLGTVNAAYLKNVPQTLTQPDGEIINCFATGDEFYHWLHDANGFTIVQDSTDGYFYYGIREGEKVGPSRYRVNSVDPASVNLEMGVKISARLYKERKDKFTLSFKTLKGAPTRGQVNNLVVYIAFADDSVIDRPRSYYKPFFSHEDSVSMKDYFREMSYNQLFVDTYHYPVSPDSINIVYIDEKPRNYFLKKSSSNPDGYSESEGQGPREHALLKRAVDFVDAQIPDTLDIDKNNDGNVDNVCFVMQGAAAGWSDLLWPHRWSLGGPAAMINGKRVRDYLLMLEGGFSVGTLCHEFFHVLGAPDLYHYEDTGAPTACGRWDIMDSNANPPQSMSAFMKYKYGKWISSLPEITESGTYTLFPLSNPDQNIFKISSPLSSSEYFVVDYRRREGRYESSVPATGMVVYRINPNAGRGNAGGPPDEVYIYRPGGDLTKNGAISSAAYGTSEKRAINDNTDPACFLYNNGSGGPGGLDIFNISSPGDSMTFEINIEPLYPPTQLVFTLGEGKVTLDWFPTYVDGLQNYIVYRNGEKFASTTLSKYDDLTIVEGENYSYSVTAVYEGEISGESKPSNEISVTPLGILELPYYQDFEAANHGWLIKGSEDGFRWGTAEGLLMNTNNTGKFLGANSVAAGQNTHTLDYAISPRFNLEGQASVLLEFDYALKIWQRFDKLTLLFRRSNTENWVPIRELGQSGFGPAYVWRHMSIEIPGEYYTSQAQLAFMYSDSNEFAYGGGIDNIEIKANTTGIESSENQFGVTVYPNPSLGSFEISIEGVEDFDIPLKVISSDGKEVWSNRTFFSGSGVMNIDLSSQADGIYYLSIEAKEKTIIRKLVKQ